LFGKAINMTFSCRNPHTAGNRGFAKTGSASATDSYCRAAGLLEELGEILGLITESARRSEKSAVIRNRTIARNLLDALDEELKFELAGDLSQTLRIIYCEAAKRIRLEELEAYIERMESAREMILEIEKAWGEIAGPSRS
jgi:flagellin-specific chaperone FliS